MIDAVIGGVREISKLVAPDAFLVDTFPACKCLYLTRPPDLLKIHAAVRYIPEWFPGTGFQKVARHGRERLHQLRSLPYEWTRKQIVLHTPTRLQHGILTILPSGSGDSTPVVYR